MFVMYALTIHAKQQISMVATSNSRDTFNPRMTSETPLKYSGKYGKGNIGMAGGG
jgi:hypothetical protein